MSQLHVRNISLANSRAVAGTLRKIQGVAAYITVTAADGSEVGVADLRGFYDQVLPTYHRMRDLTAAGYRLQPWDQLTDSQLERLGGMTTWKAGVPQLADALDDLQEFAEQHRDWLIPPQ